MNRKNRQAFLSRFVDTLDRLARRGPRTLDVPITEEAIRLSEDALRTIDECRGRVQEPVYIVLPLQRVLNAWPGMPPTTFAGLGVILGEGPQIMVLTK